MSSLSDILLMTYLATGESSSGSFANWGESANSNWNFIEDTIGEVVSKALSNINVTLTAAEERALTIKLTGTLTGNVEVRTNDRKGFWFVRNGTTGAFTVTFKPTSGTGIVVPQNTAAILVCDGTNTLQMSSLPTTSTDNAVWRAAGTAGGFQGSGVVIDDSANVFRTINTGFLNLNGGDADGTGANIQLAGGAHASLPNQAFHDAASHTFRTQSGGSINDTLVDVSGRLLLRDTSNRAVVAAQAAQMFFRPNGTASTAGEMTIATSGDVVINGTLTVTG